MDVAVYDLFDACGLGGADFTSLATESGQQLTVDDVRPALCEAYEQVFGIAFDPLPAAV